MSLLTSSTNQDEGKRDLHCWKQKLKSYAATKTLEVGVRCVTPADGLNCFVEVERRFSWSCETITQQRQLLKRFSRSDNPLYASISSVEVGDIISCYLNCETEKLIIYNQRSKQSEIFTDVGGRIFPIVQPVLHYQRDEPLKIHPLYAVTVFTLDI